MKSKIKVSIRTKITLMVVIFAAFVAFSSWFLCTFLLKGILVANVKKNLSEVYNTCNKIFKTDRDLANFNEGLYNDIGLTSDMIIIIYNPDSGNVYTSMKYGTEFQNDVYEYVYKMSAINRKANNQKGEYLISIGRDEDSDRRYYDLVGTLNNDNIIMIRSPIEHIEDSMAILARIFAWIAVAIIVFGSIFILIFSNIFTIPLKKLSVTARKIASLDFDTKVPVYTKDEIGELSQCMNEMSIKLERTISELKSANIKLSRDIEKKDKLDDMRKEFLSHVSHELKTPIALIQGYAEGLKDNLVDDEESKEFYTEVIIDEAHKMNMLVKRLLALNEIEFGGTPVNIERFELVGFLGDIIASSKILLDNVDATLVFDEKSPVYVWADEYMIEEAFINYLTNAIHYVKSGGLIKVYLEKRDGDVRVNVFNQGENISEEDISKLFLKFYKSDKARTREYGGNGIGLSVVAATLEAHKKAYGVYNVSDGVVFYFDLDANMPC